MDFVSGRAMRPQDIYWKPSSKKRKKSNKGRQRTIWYNKRGPVGLGRRRRWRWRRQLALRPTQKTSLGWVARLVPRWWRRSPRKRALDLVLGVYVTETDSSGWLKKGAQSGKWFRGLVMTLGWIYQGGLLTQWSMVNDWRRLSRHQCLQTIGLQVRVS